MHLSHWSSLAVAALLTVIAMPATAASFPDVSATHIFVGAVDALSEKGVIMGDPTGLFHPERTVNRAEFLTMLYRASGEKTDDAVGGCFKDVPKDTWFGPTICHAVMQGAVGGYPDKTFRPAKPVNRVEAIKMLFTVLQLPLQATATANAQVLAYTDVAPSAWYMLYVPSAFERGILPVPGADATNLGPDVPLMRGEAAAYIANALKIEWMAAASSSSSEVIIDVSSAVEASSIMASAVSTSAPSSIRSKTSTSSSVSSAMKTLSYPFQEQGTLTGRATAGYKFTLAKGVTMLLTSTLTGGGACRLYKLEKETDFSLEFYLGHASGDACVMRVALTPGSYQIDLAPALPSAQYSLKAQDGSGDGNDGFAQARPLSIGAVRGDILDGNDTGDWYTFTVAKAASMQVDMISADKLSCSIYPLGNVDVYGFAGPACGTSYLYTPGTYVVGVGPRDGRATTKVTYSVRLTTVAEVK